MNLGKLIERLEQQPPERIVMAWHDDNGVNQLGDDELYIGEEDSYRGYYEQLAFEPTDTPSTCEELLARCRGAIGSVYHGYKGGEYRMSEHTPVWFSQWGGCGQRMLFARPEKLTNGQTVLKIYVSDGDW